MTHCSRPDRNARRHAGAACAAIGGLLWLAVSAVSPAGATPDPQSCTDAPGVSRTLVLGPGQNLDGGADVRAALQPGEVVLTFDDGPDPRTTPAILDALAAGCVRATFFPIGESAGDYPKLLRRILSEGHNLGGHGFAHERLTDMPFERATRDMEQGFASLRAIGETPRLFRFPHLAQNRRLRAWLSDRGVAVIGVDIDSMDWDDGPPAETLARIEAELDERGSGVILLHDVQPNTVKVVPALLAMLGRKGFRIVHVEAAAGP